MIRSLDLMTEDMKSASELYRPTNYWEVLLPEITGLIDRLGMAVKSYPHFTSTYCTGDYARHPMFWRTVLATLEKFPGSIGPAVARRLRNELFSFHMAERHYVAFAAADRRSAPPFLHEFRESEFGGVPGRAGYWHEFNGISYSRVYLKYLRCLAMLKKNVHDQSRSIRNVIELGGGFAPMGEIMLRAGNDYFYVDVDIPPMAALAAEYLRGIFGEDAVLDYSLSREMDRIEVERIRRTHRAMVLCPWQIERLQGEFELFANFTSFQEMEPAVVENYARMFSPLLTRYALIMNRKLGQPKASQPGQRGVIHPVSMDYILRCFKDFEVLDRDQDVFGLYEQEAAVLARHEL